MDIEKEILLRLEDIKRELIEINKISQASAFEVWSSWWRRSVSPIGRNLKKSLPQPEK